VANVATQLLVLDLCMALGFNTIVIPALMDAKDVEGSDELKINSYEASWLGNGCRGLEGSIVTNFHFLVTMSLAGAGRRDVDRVTKCHCLIIMSRAGGKEGLLINSHEVSRFGNNIAEWRGRRGVDRVTKCHGLIIMSRTGGK
jgi:hypothetical protein